MLQAYLISQLSLWDTAGQERYPGFSPIYYRNAAGVLLVYDLTKQGALIGCENWLNGAPGM